MSEHNFHPVHEGCTRCAALPGEDTECFPEGTWMPYGQGHMDDHMPSLHEVRTHFCCDLSGVATREQAEGEFDRFMDKVKADAFDEGDEARQLFIESNDYSNWPMDFRTQPVNPYRGGNE